ncbi:hypothetical protein KFL_001010340 [Klebsormidium nitens]|uniref:Uncharacterized protein n=1 Tax=Klebsormidium nitens TaxID=105231 RepID=A0A1Y1HYA4_KLENI|nr:hypothetical protein KFL_001010340 [Klebsormidium nitens]|eukprot:GAQ82149.1 hypothetical protein KFL_001010340 [Klebsormidium nitens]
MSSVHTINSSAAASGANGTRSKRGVQLARLGRMFQSNLSPQRSRSLLQFAAASASCALTWLHLRATQGPFS